MINVWDYQNAKRIKIICDDGQIFSGSVCIINDVEDEDEDYGLGEDSITLWVNDIQPMTFVQSEIVAIEVLE